FFEFRPVIGVRSFGSGRRHIDRKSLRVLQILFHHLRRIGPVLMVVLPIDDQSPDRLASLGAGKGKGEHGRCELSEWHATVDEWPPRREGRRESNSMKSGRSDCNATKGVFVRGKGRPES